MNVRFLKQSWLLARLPVETVYICDIYAVADGDWCSLVRSQISTEWKGWWDGLDNILSLSCSSPSLKLTILWCIRWSLTLQNNTASVQSRTVYCRLIAPTSNHPTWSTLHGSCLSFQDKTQSSVEVLLHFSEEEIVFFSSQLREQLNPE